VNIETSLKQPTCRKKRCNAQKKKTISDRSRSRFNSHRQNKKQNKKNGPNRFDIPGGGKQKIGSLSALLELSLNPFVLPLMMESYLQ
jgi:hypothetical protein